VIFPVLVRRCADAVQQVVVTLADRPASGHRIGLHGDARLGDLLPRVAIGDVEVAVDGRITGERSAPESHAPLTTFGLANCGSTTSRPGCAPTAAADCHSLNNGCRFWRIFASDAPAASIVPCSSNPAGLDFTGCNSQLAKLANSRDGAGILADSVLAKHSRLAVVAAPAAGRTDCMRIRKPIDVRPAHRGRPMARGGHRQPWTDYARG
jgi:hypothetical protein